MMPLLYTAGAPLSGHPECLVGEFKRGSMLLIVFKVNSTAISYYQNWLHNMAV